MGSRNEKQALEQLPAWAPEYLACWGSKKPDGGRMTVRFAAEFAGVTPSAVRNLRERSATFSRLEEIARHAGAEWAQTYIEAGLRALAPGLMRALAELIADKNAQTVLKGIEWLRNKPQALSLEGTVGVSQGGWDLSGLSDDELDQMLLNLDVIDGAEE